MTERERLEKMVENMVFIAVTALMDNQISFENVDKAIESWTHVREFADKYVQMWEEFKKEQENA